MLRKYTWGLNDSCKRLWTRRQFVRHPKDSNVCNWRRKFFTLSFERSGRFLLYHSSFTLTEDCSLRSFWLEFLRFYYRWRGSVGRLNLSFYNNRTIEVNWICKTQTVYRLLNTFLVVWPPRVRTDSVLCRSGTSRKVYVSRVPEGGLSLSPTYFARLWSHVSKNTGPPVVSRTISATSFL